MAYCGRDEGPWDEPANASAGPAALAPTVREPDDTARYAGRRGDRLRRGVLRPEAGLGPAGVRDRPGRGPDRPDPLRLDVPERRELIDAQLQARPADPSAPSGVPVAHPRGGLYGLAVLGRPAPGGRDRDPRPGRRRRVSYR